MASQARKATTSTAATETGEPNRRRPSLPNTNSPPNSRGPSPSAGLSVRVPGQETVAPPAAQQQAIPIPPHHRSASSGGATVGAASSTAPVTATHPRSASPSAALVAAFTNGMRTGQPTQPPQSQPQQQRPPQQITDVQQVVPPRGQPMPIPVAGAPQQQPQAAVRLGQTPPNQQGTHLPPGTRPPVPLGSTPPLVNFVGQQPPSSASASPQLRPQANAAAPSLLAHPPTVQPIRTVQPQAQRPSASPPQQRAPVPQRPALAKAGKPSGSVAIDVGYSPPPANISTFFHACSDYHPLLSKRSEYFQPDIPYDPNAVVLGSLTPSHSNVPRVRSDSVTSPAVIRDIISVVVPCFTESARNLKHTLYDLWRMQREMHKNSTFFEFHVCLILDGWSKAPSSLKAYIHTLFQSEAETGPAKMQAYAKQFEKDVRREEMRANKTPKTPAQAPTANGSAVVSSDSSSSDSSSSSDDDESSSEDDRKAEVKFLKPSSTEERGQMKAFSPLARASAGSYTRSTTNSATKSVEVEDDEGSGLNFPESASFDLFSSQSASTSDAFGGGATGKAAAGKTNSGPARTWEKYISNWSADSDLNPPLQPETLIIQKWITHDGLPAGVQANGNGIKSGHATTIRSIAAIPIFHESDFTANETVSSDPEELRRKKEARLKLTVIVKRDNRRKHNSHEWFLRGFAPVYTTKLNASTTSPSGVQLIFMTDAGTRFHKACVLSLVQYLLQNPSTVACSGRQRVMTHKQQNEGEPKEDKLSIGYLRGQLYRCAQGFEYEASISAFNGAFDFTGLLPVLPGPCGLFRLDIILREGTAEDQQRAIEKEKLRILVGKLRAIHTSQSRALAEFHGYIWASLTVSKQMHRATWAQYCKRQLTQTALVRTGTASNVNTGGSNVLEPFTPFEKDRAVFKFLDLKTHLFALTDEVNKNQLIVITVLLRLDPDSPCLQGLQQMLGQETVLWQRQQALLVLVKQLYELESTYSATLASSEGSYSQGIVKDWDRQMHHQLDQLRKLLNQQIYHLKDFLLSIERSPASGRILDLITKELSLDQAELDYVTDARAKLELSQAKDPVDFYFSIVNIVGQQRHRNADPMPDRKNCCSC